MRCKRFERMQRKCLCSALKRFTQGINVYTVYASMSFLQRNINFVWVMSIYRRLYPDHIYIVQPLEMSLNFNTRIINHFYFKGSTFQKYVTVYFFGLVKCQYNICLKIIKWLLFSWWAYVTDILTIYYYTSDYVFVNE